MTTARAVTLRGAGPEDAAFLFRLRTDPVTAAMSFGPVPTAEGHAVWLHDTLANPERRLWIAEDGETPVGVVRLDRVATTAATVNITVAPEARRMGVGTAMLAAIDAAAPVWGVTHLVAEILPTNEASQRLFAQAGYTRTRPGVWEKGR